jgi:hypothetical protein
MHFAIALVTMALAAVTRSNPLTEFKAALYLPKEYANLKILPDGEFPVHVNLNTTGLEIPVVTNVAGFASDMEPSEVPVWVSNGTHVTSFASYSYSAWFNTYGLVYNRFAINMWGPDTADFYGDYWGAGGAASGPGNCWLQNSARGWLTLNGKAV